jgi:hypothetical protein
MHKFSPTVPARLLLAGCVLIAPQFVSAQGSPPSTIRNIKVLGSKGAVEIEIEASDRLVPQTRVLQGPDRLVIDFPNSTPSNALRNQSVNQGEVKDLRFGLFQSKPPVTRIVLDLKTAQSFQVFPYGRTVMIKVSGAVADEDASADDPAPKPATRPGLVVANYTNRAEPVRIAPVTTPVPIRPALEVTFNNGLLSIHSDKATLSEVLFAVQQRTGAEVSIAAGAEQEKVVADIGPAPAPEVLAQLLNGSRFNFLILNAANDPQQLDRVILSPRPERLTNQPPVAQGEPEEEDIPPQPVPPPARAPQRVAPPGVQPPASQPEIKQPDETNPDQ